MVKLLTLSFIALFSLSAFASTKVFSKKFDPSEFSLFDNKFKTSFYVDPETNEGAVLLTVLNCTTDWNSSFGDVCFAKETRSFTIKGLKRVNDSLVYTNEGEEIICGEYGLSRYRRVPTLYLSGRCEAKMDVTWGRERNPSYELSFTIH